MAHLVQFCSFCIRSTWSHLSEVSTVAMHTFTPTTHRCMAPGSCSPSHVDSFLSIVSDCVNAVAGWMQSNRLQLNNDNRPSSCCGVQRFVASIVCPIGSFTVTPSSTVRDLGVYIHSSLSMHSHVRRTVSRCFAVLHYTAELRTIRGQWRSHGGLGGTRPPPLVPRTDCGIRPDPMRSW